MPWNTNGTFTRTNAQFFGADVWQKDQQASIKIIATRHDYHDEDLALGIANCLNLDGYNTMRADLDMGGYCIINQCGGGGGTDLIERGVWTPYIEGTQPDVLTAGMYQRIDDVVTIFADIRWGAISGAPTEDIVITGLPFNMATDANGAGRMFVAKFMAWDNLNLGGFNVGGGVSTDEWIPEVFTRTLVRWSNTEAKIIRYIGSNDLTAPNAIEYPKLDDLQQTGEISFTWSYLTDDPFTP